MRVVIQRVSQASVSISGKTIAEINQGLVLLLGIVEDDTEADIDWIIGKITRMRIFSDGEGKMNRSLADVSGGLLVVSQFTLHANTKKGNRPSFIKAARPSIAVPLYEAFLAVASQAMERPCVSGEFGADMQVALVNDGPVTIIIDSKKRE